MGGGDECLLGGGEGVRGRPGTLQPQRLPWPFLSEWDQLRSFA